MLSNMIAGRPIAGLRTRETLGTPQIFGNIFGYEGIKRTFIRSLNSQQPVHILLVGPPGQAKTLFLRPYYLLIDEIEHLKPEYQTTLLSLMETGILTQTMHSKVRHTHLKTWVFVTSNGRKKLFSFIAIILSYQPAMISHHEMETHGLTFI